MTRTILSFLSWVEETQWVLPVAVVFGVPFLVGLLAR